MKSNLYRQRWCGVPCRVAAAAVVVVAVVILLESCVNTNAAFEIASYPPANSPNFRKLQPERGIFRPVVNGRRTTPHTDPPLTSLRSFVRSFVSVHRAERSEDRYTETRIARYYGDNLAVETVMERVLRCRIKDASETTIRPRFLRPPDSQLVFCFNARRDAVCTCVRRPGRIFTVALVFFLSLPSVVLPQ